MNVIFQTRAIEKDVNRYIFVLGMGWNNIEQAISVHGIDIFGERGKSNPVCELE